MYCDVEDIREEGITEEMAATPRVEAQIKLATAYIDMITRRFFEGKTLVLKLNGSGDDTLFLDYPIVSIEYIKISDTQYELNDFDIYNRLYPDDRDCPMIVYSDGTFPEGHLNIEISGVFGYLDVKTTEGEEETRVTPELIKRACVKLVIRDFIPELADDDAQEEIRRRWVIEEKTDGHSYKLSELAVSGGSSGDQEVDSILAMYRRPIGIALV